MGEAARHFLKDESGGVSLDWVVLTSVLVGTGLAVMLTVRDGVSSVTTDVAGQLEGQVVRSSFQSYLCPEGVPGLQAREDVRAEAADELPLDVAGWMLETYGTSSDREVREALEAASKGVSVDEGWTSARIQAAATGCELASRGLD